MRDLYDDTPVLRLGAAPAKPKTDPLQVDTDKLTMVEVEIPSPVVVEVERAGRAYTFEDVSISITGQDGRELILGSASDAEISIGVDLGVDDRTVVALLGNVAHEIRGQPNRGPVGFVEVPIASDAELEAFAKLACESVARTYGLPARLLSGPEGPMTATQKADLDRFYERFKMSALEDGAVRYEPAPRLHPLIPSCRAVEPEVLSEEEFARRHPGPVPMMVYDEAAPVPREAWDYLGRRTINHRPIGVTEAEWRDHLRKNHDALVKKDPRP